jgi:hypothetical protein
VPRYILRSSVDLVLSKLFSHDDRGRIAFVWGAPVEDGELSNLATEPLSISDFIMEAGVRYTVQVQPHPEGCELVAIGMGSN